MAQWHAMFRSYARDLDVNLRDLRSSSSFATRGEATLGSGLATSMHDQP